MAAATNSCDVAIVGAGVSGLTVCHQLLKARPELQILVLEAGDRVGGRTLTKEVRCSDGGSRGWCFGGGRVGKSQKCVLSLMKELGLSNFEVTRPPGKSILEIGDTVDRYEGETPNLGALTLVDLDRSLKSLDKQSKTLMQNRGSWATLDGMTLAKKIEKETWKQSTRHCLEAITQPYFYFEGAADKISCLQAMRIANSAGGLISLMSEGDGLRIVEGAQAICTKIASRLGSDRILLGREVTEIATTAVNSESSSSASPENEGPLRVVTRGGDHVTARYVVLTLPLSTLSRLRFSPDQLLPPEKRSLFSAASTFAADSAVSAVVTYPTAFWRRAGYTGDILSHLGSPVTAGHLPVAPVAIATDATSPDGYQPALALLTGYTAEHRWPSPEARRADVLAHLSRFYPAEEVASYTDYVEHDWGQDMPAGSPSGASPLPVGASVCGRVYCDPASLTQPVGRVHFAGTDFAADWIGTIEGAVQSGGRAAREVLARI